MNNQNQWLLAADNGSVPDLAVFTRTNPIGPDGTIEHTDTTNPDANSNLNPSGVAALPQVQIYEHKNFGGHNVITSLNWIYVGDWWNDKISAIVVVRGRWRFYQHSQFRGNYWDLNPGFYPWVENVSIPNDVISSFKVIGY